MTRDTFVTRDGCKLAYEVEGDGLPVLWQHGLGAERAQPAEVFPDLPGVRRVTLECRGHGASDLGDTGRISIAQFAADALALLDHLGIDTTVAGGISLGAALALRLGAGHPDRIKGLVLGRPAWVDEAGPDHLQIYRDVAELIATCGLKEGRRRFDRSPRIREIEAASPDNAASLRWFFERRRPETTVALLSRIPSDGPGLDRVQIGAIAAPAVVIANGEDAIHSVATAQALAALLPNARLLTITSKTVSRQAYVAEFKAAIATFLTGEDLA